MKPPEPVLGVRAENQSQCQYRSHGSILVRMKNGQKEQVHQKKPARQVVACLHIYFGCEWNLGDRSRIRSRLSSVTAAVKTASAPMKAASSMESSTPMYS